MIDGDTLAVAEDALARVTGVALVVPDLCAMVEAGGGPLEELAGRGELTVLACHPRAVRWLLAAAGLEPTAAELVDLRSGLQDGALDGLGAARAEAVTPAEVTGGPGAGWFPVLDLDRCTHCGQCASFCLFGVYGQDDRGRVVVTDPDGCKDNCPACARVCPETAIIFPKLGEAPLNGAAVTGEAAGPVAVDLDRAVGADLYRTLKSRRTKLKRRLLRREALARAERERCACLDEAEAGGRR